MNDRNVSADEAKRIGETLGVNWAKIDPAGNQNNTGCKYKPVL